MIVRKVVIPVAGLGTRMLPATKVVPKELVTVVRKPAVQWVVEGAVASGATEIVLVTSAEKSAIEEHFARSPALEAALEARGKAGLAEELRALASLARISTVRQPAPLGLGHAVLMAHEAVGDETFAVILPDELLHHDVPPLAQCLSALDPATSGVLGLLRVPRSEAVRYGMVSATERPDGTFLVHDMVEKPKVEDAPSDLAIVGPYVLPPGIFDDLERATPGSAGEIQLTDALRAMARRKPFVGRIIEGERLDTGTALGFVEANVVKCLADPELGPALRRWLTGRLAGG